MKPKTIRDGVTLSSGSRVLENGYAAALKRSAFALRLIVKAFYEGVVRNKSVLLIGVSLFYLLGACTAPVFDPKNFVFIRGGEFTMGSPENEVGREDHIIVNSNSNDEFSFSPRLWDREILHQSSETQHQVKLSDFYMGKYAVTVGEFRKFVEATGYQTEAEKRVLSDIVVNNETWKAVAINWRHGVSDSMRPQNEENHPVLHVSWNDAVAYCKWLSKETGKKFRLPTEAEREYACRAGTTTPFNTGNNLTTDQANYDGNYPYNDNPKGVYRENTVAVNSFVPNAWGLYNMHGNVFEWCSDWYGGTYYDECKANGTVTNPAGPSKGSDRVLRGGGWGNPAGSCRSADRGDFTSRNPNGDVGFRVVFVP